MHLSNYMAGKNPDGKVLKDEDVAVGIKRSRVTVSRIRRGKVRPDWATIKALEEFTGGLVTANDFTELPEETAEASV
jgi:transcriptional regulator with XRE-family HTH domain